VNDGHTVKIELGPSVDAQVQDLEFHWPSEFVIDGHRFPLEMKMKRCNNTQCWFDIFLYDVSVHHNLWMNSVVKIIEFAEEPIQLVAFNGSLPSLDLNLLHSEFLSRPNVLWMSGHDSRPPCQHSDFFIHLPVQKMSFKQFLKFMRIRRCSLKDFLMVYPFMFGNYRQLQESQTTVYEAESSWN